MITPLPSKGDIVDVTLKGVRVTHVEPARDGFSATVYVAIPRPDGGDYNTIALCALSPALTVTTVERAAPADWPPRPGDLWRDGDLDLWFATTAHVYQHGPEGDFPAVPVVELVHAGGGPSRKPDEVNRECGPLELVHREQADGPEAEAEAVKEPVGWPPRVGDVWRDGQADDWHAVGRPDGVMLRLHEGATLHSPEYVLRNYEPLKLVKR